MSTRAYIILPPSIKSTNPKAICRGVQINCSGDDLVATLSTHYTTADKVRDLIAGGERVSLGHNPDSSPTTADSVTDGRTFPPFDFPSEELMSFSWMPLSHVNHIYVLHEGHSIWEHYED
jgi:hypothetical protein